MSLFEPRSASPDLFRPFLWLALFAFLVGFSGYLALGARQMTTIRERVATPIAAPAVAASNAARAA